MANGIHGSWRGCATPRIKVDEATIARSLRGHWREEHIFELTQALELYRLHQDKIAECDREIEAQLERFEDRSDGQPPAPNGKKRNQKNAPRFDVQNDLYRMTGVDLTRIDGVDGFTALKVISEIGTDMTKWPSARHFASWLGLSPNNRITGGKVISSKDQAQCQPRGGGIASGGQRAAPLRQRPGRLPAPEEGPTGRAQSHHGHGPQAGQDHLLHAALRPGIRGRRGRILREAVSGPGAARGQAAGSTTGLSAGANLPDAPEHTTYAPPARQLPRDDAG